jgi:putative FmdB family regulatory protein
MRGFSMPIYEYECGACGHRLEAIQKMADAPLIDCPTCHKTTLQKLISSAGFQLKGTGWYATDFRDKNKKVDPEKKLDKDSGTQTGSDTAASSPPKTDTEKK